MCNNSVRHVTLSTYFNDFGGFALRISDKKYRQILHITALVTRTAQSRSRDRFSEAKRRSLAAEKLA
jgi:hypothetical protein